MLFILNSIVFSFFVFSFLFFGVFSLHTRFNLVQFSLYRLLTSFVSSNVCNALFLSFFTALLTLNLTGNIPLNSIPTLFYRSTLTLSLLFWVPLVLCVSITQIKEFMAHILPYGSPVGLILFLPLVEIFSQLIRPFTLIIRLRTNLSSGHIIIYIFSYFTLLSSVLAPFIYIVLYILFFLELAISILQAYIFVSLLTLYINETA